MGVAHYVIVSLRVVLVTNGVANVVVLENTMVLFWTLLSLLAPSSALLGALHIL